MSDTTMKNEDTRKSDTTMSEAGATAGRERAATERLLVLLAAHGQGEWAARFAEESAGEEARTRWGAASLCAAIFCALPRLRAAGVTWEELRDVFEGGGARTDRALRAAKLIGRAHRLVMRLVFRGVSQGEIASAGRHAQKGH